MQLHMNIICRKAGLKDVFYVFSLRNLASDRELYLSTKRISLLQHLSFWLRYWHCYSICWAGSTRIGYCGIVKDDFRFAVEPKYRGKGFGKNIIKVNIDFLRGKLVRVKKENKASLKSFEANGFKIVGQDDNCLYLQF